MLPSRLFTYLAALSVTLFSHAIILKSKVEQIDPQHMRVEIECQLAPDEMLFHDSLHFSCNIPSVKIGKWFARKDPHTYFDPRAKQSDPVYSDVVTITVMLESAQAIPAHIQLTMHYRTNRDQHAQEKVVTVAANSEERVCAPATPSAPERSRSSWYSRLEAITKQITSLIKDKQLPLIFKFGLAFIIGIIMSFTPCIYPMIPITMGILQSNKSHSFVRSFALASSYTAGLSTTFALLGMLAAYGGATFGSAMSSAWVIVPIVLFFAYLGFSMLGLYEMYIPRFMQPRQGHKNDGSLLSAFTFGAINGTVASPCLSPGLALILGIVAGLGNPVLGFLLLFVFGVGSSIPLLVIGTFSGSLHILPRAGMWMVEFKKIFGFLLLGMCIYYLKPFMGGVELLFGALYVTAVAGYYIYYGFKNRSWVAHGLGILLLLASVFTIYIFIISSYRVSESPGKEEPILIWNTGYETTRSRAIAEHQLILLDFTAGWCSMCKRIEKQFFNTSFMSQELTRRVIPLKIDCTDNNGVECVGARKKFGVMGYPAIILMDPQTETVLQRWDSDLINRDSRAFINEIDRFIK